MLSLDLFGLCIGNMCFVYVVVAKLCILAKSRTYTSTFSCIVLDILHSRHFVLLLSFAFCGYVTGTREWRRAGLGNWPSQCASTRLTKLSHPLQWLSRMVYKSWRISYLMATAWVWLSHEMSGTRKPGFRAWLLTSSHGLLEELEEISSTVLQRSTELLVFELSNSFQFFWLLFESFLDHRKLRKRLFLFFQFCWLFQFVSHVIGPVVRTPLLVSLEGWQQLLPSSRSKVPVANTWSASTLVGSQIGS